MKKIEIKQGKHLREYHVSCAEQRCDIEITLHEGAKGELLVRSAKGATAQTIVANLGKDSSLNIISLDTDAEDFERKVDVFLQADGSQCNLNGVFITSNKQRCVNKISVKHLAPNCTSFQNFRGVASGVSYALFNGAIYVAHDAQETIAMQNNHNVVVNDGAKIETMPQLEIYADRVKCNHGATIGRQDEAAMFYMRQRGIETKMASALLLEGFCLSALLDVEKFGEEIYDEITLALNAKLSVL